MFKGLRRVGIASLATVATAAILTAGMAPASGAVPVYPYRYGHTQIGNCINTTSGRSVYSSTYGGYVFVAASQGNTPIYCWFSYVEVVYIDTHGVERYLQTYDYTPAAWATGSPSAVIQLRPGQYSTILEVVGYSATWSYNTSPAVYLYF